MLWLTVPQATGAGQYLQIGLPELNYATSPSGTPGPAAG